MNRDARTSTSSTSPAMDLVNTGQNRSTWKVMLHFMRAFPRRTALMIFLLILAGFAEGVGVVTLLPLLEFAEGNAGGSRVSRAIASVVEAAGISPTIPVLLALIVVGISLKSLLIWIAMRQVGYTMAHVTTRLRLDLIQSLLTARWRYYTSRPKGKLTGAIGWEVQRAATTFREGCVSLASVFQIVMYAVISFLISWQMTVFALLGGGALLLGLRRFVEHSRVAGQQQTALMQSLIRRLIDTMYGIKPVKAMARERHLLPLLENDIQGLNRAQQQLVQSTQALKLFQEPAMALMLAAGMFVLLTFGNQPLSGVMVMAFLFYRLMQNVNNVQMRYQIMANSESGFWAFQAEIQEARREREEHAGRRDAPPLKKEIVLQEVSFGYDASSTVLNDVSLRIPAGQFVALVGTSGSGKTTLADLIIGLHRPRKGEIYIDGVPLSEVDLMKWRNRIGYVPQETLLFHDSILKNVTLGDQGISRDDVEWALRAAGAWDFVSQRARGMDEIVGEQGAKLSGGQRQRIAIARALAIRPSLLVLDEATTALDPATEREICETLSKLRGMVTIVSISHQNAMQEAADVIYLLDRGEVRTLGSTRSAEGSSLPASALT